MSHEVLVWMANLPLVLGSAGVRPTSVGAVSRFFQRLADKWENMLRSYLLQRQIPLRHRELVGVLQLRSMNLRLAFFNWSVRFLNVYAIPANANIIAALKEKFEEDQDFYMDQSRSKEDYEAHDHKMATVFSALITAAKRGHGRSGESWI